MCSYANVLQQGILLKWAAFIQMIVTLDLVLIIMMRQGIFLTWTTSVLMICPKIGSYDLNMSPICSNNRMTTVSMTCISLTWPITKSPLSPLLIEEVWNALQWGFLPSSRRYFEQFLSRYNVLYHKSKFSFSRSYLIYVLSNLSHEDFHIFLDIAIRGSYSCAATLIL